MAITSEIKSARNAVFIPLCLYVAFIRSTHVHDWNVVREFVWQLKTWTWNTRSNFTISYAILNNVWTSQYHVNDCRCYVDDCRSCVASGSLSDWCCWRILVITIQATSLHWVYLLSNVSITMHMTQMSANHKACTWPNSFNRYKLGQLFYLQKLDGSLH